MRGFTLVELMTVVTIFTLIFAAMFGVLTMGRKSWQIGTAQVEAQQQARIAMDAMLRELRGASSVDQSTFSGGVSDGIIRFSSRGEMVEFALNANQIQRTAAGVTTVVANDIEAAQFTLLGGNVVRVTLTARRTSVLGGLIEISLNSQVVLRN